MADNAKKTRRNFMFAHTVARLIFSGEKKLSISALATKIYAIWLPNRNKMPTFAT